MIFTNLTSLNSVSVTFVLCLNSLLISAFSKKVSGIKSAVLSFSPNSTTYLLAVLAMLERLLPVLFLFFIIYFLYKCLESYEKLSYISPFILLIFDQAFLEPEASYANFILFLRISNYETYDPISS